MVCSLTDMEEVLKQSFNSKFLKRKPFKVVCVLPYYSPHLTLSSARNFSLLRVFCFYSTSANAAQRDKTAARYFWPLKWSLFPTWKPTALYSNKAKHSLADFRSIVFIHFLLFIHSTFNFLFNSAEFVRFLLKHFVNSRHLQRT